MRERKGTPTTRLKYTIPRWMALGLFVIASYHSKQHGYFNLSMIKFRKIVDGICLFVYMMTVIFQFYGLLVEMWINWKGSPMCQQPSVYLQHCPTL